jgi:nicotinate-nucleotide pyrophosphorylase (carboxylating)
MLDSYTGQSRIGGISMLPQYALTLEIHKNVTAALSEDIGTGDLTAQLIPTTQTSYANVIMREQAVLCGTAWFDTTFSCLDPRAKIHWNYQDGEIIPANEPICDIECNTRALLTAERTALNLLQLLSGTATLTRQFVHAVAHTRAKIVDTRKTIPGLRAAQKYAVRCGGGTNHRHGLYDGILIKENHIIAARGIAPALERARAMTNPQTFIQIEVESLAELEAALAAEAKMILLDNMCLEDMRAAVALTAGRALLEASGGVNLDNIAAIAETGIDRISIGCLTKDVRAIDLSLRHTEKPARHFSLSRPPEDKVD